jgi:hypothetical protein
MSAAAEGDRVLYARQAKALPARSGSISYQRDDDDGRALA